MEYTAADFKAGQLWANTLGRYVRIVKVNDFQITYHFADRPAHDTNTRHVGMTTGWVKVVS